MFDVKRSVLEKLRIVNSGGDRNQMPETFYIETSLIQKNTPSETLFYDSCKIPSFHINAVDFKTPGSIHHHAKFLINWWNFPLTLNPSILQMSRGWVGGHFSPTHSCYNYKKGLRMRQPIRAGSLTYPRLKSTVRKTACLILNMENMNWGTKKHQK